MAAGLPGAHARAPPVWKQALDRGRRWAGHALRWVGQALRWVGHARVGGRRLLGVVLMGAAVGSMFVGLLNTFGQVLFPELAYFVIFGPMAVLLAFRPLGLFGAKELT